MADRLKDKVAIVTGSSSGIGKAIALTFAAQGATVTLCGRDKGRLRSVLENVVKVSGGHNERFITFAGDLTDHEVRNELIHKTVKTFGRLDIFVSNAGTLDANGSISNATEESYNRIMNTNLKSVFFLIQQVVPHLEKSKGNIVIVSSNGSIMVWPNLTVYSIGKAALTHLASCLAVDLGVKGIRVNSVLPGYIPTNIFRFCGENMENICSVLSKEDSVQQPLKERALTEDDVAETVAFLASDAAGCITGEHVKVDGGRTYGGLSDPAIFAS